MNSKRTSIRNCFVWRGRRLHALDTRSLSALPERQRAKRFIEMAQFLGEKAHYKRCEFVFEELLTLISHFEDAELRFQTALSSFEGFFGDTFLRKTLSKKTDLKKLAFLALTVLAHFAEIHKSAFARCVHFVELHLAEFRSVSTTIWGKLLEKASALENWTYVEYDPNGYQLWSVQGRSSILGLLAQDFAGVADREWVDTFWQLLKKQVFLFPPGQDRERALKSLVRGLLRYHRGNEAWCSTCIQEILEKADAIEDDASHVYLSVFNGFLEQGALPRALAAAHRIHKTAFRDQAFFQLAEAWCQRGNAEQAVQMLYEIDEYEARGEAALSISLASCVVQDPTACSRLCQIVSVLPGVTQQVLQQIASHPDLPGEAREAILIHAPDEILGRYARQERLAQLERVKTYLPRDVYLEEKRALFGLSGDFEQLLPNEELSGLHYDIVIDRPHCYGDGLYLTPAEHVQKNHFGDEVAGSQFTAWESFELLWVEIYNRVQQECSEEEGVQVIELSFPIDVGVTGVVPIEKVLPEALAIELRNGQPSLYCIGHDMRQPTRSMTVVLGPSFVTADEISGYPGHDISLMLYTIYPGKPAEPFPACEKKEFPFLRKALGSAIALLMERKVEEAKSFLYETYSALEGSDESARYWSQNILIH